MKLRLGTAVVMMAAVFSLGAQEPTRAFEGQVAVTCTLKKALNSRDATEGQEITAMTEKPAKINGVAIPRGSLLTGHVVNATPYKKGEPIASMTIVFDKVEPKKGTAFPVDASVLGIGLSDAQVQGKRQDLDVGMRGSGTEAKVTVRDDANQVSNGSDGMGSAIPGVSLSTMPGGDRSAIMTSLGQNVALAHGTEMVIGVKAK
jgi:hypothetical protein